VTLEKKEKKAGHNRRISEKGGRSMDRDASLQERTWKRVRKIILIEECLGRNWKTSLMKLGKGKETVAVEKQAS